jgi:hypothetical protein
MGAGNRLFIDPKKTHDSVRKDGDLVYV